MNHPVRLTLVAGLPLVWDWWLEPGQRWVEVLFIIFPPVGSHELPRETAAHRAAQEQRARQRRNVKHTQSLSPRRGGLWPTKRVLHLHRPAQWKLREANEDTRRDPPPLKWITLTLSVGPLWTWTSNCTSCRDKNTIKQIGSNLKCLKFYSNNINSNRSIKSHLLSLSKLYPF